MTLRSRRPCFRPGLTLRGNRIIGLGRTGGLGAAAALAALLSTTSASADPVVTIPAANAAEATPRVGFGDGLCGHFIQAAAGGTVNNAALASAILSGAPGAPAQKAPAGLNNGDSSFYGIAYLIDYFDDSAGTNGSFKFDALFPWSKATTGQICISQQGTHPPAQNDAFAAGFTGLLNVKTAGTKTFAIGSDDGYRLKIGGITAAAYDANRGPALDTRRVKFDAPGVYEVELLYWEQGGLALLEWSISDAEVQFTGNNVANPVAVGAAGANDLTNAGTGTLPASFITVGNSTGHQIFLRDADKQNGTCGLKVGLPSDICVLTDPVRLCGDGGISSIATSIEGSNPPAYTYTQEECDDGGKVNGDGCSSTCKIEPGYTCVGSPSLCDTDTDGDGLPNKVEDAIGTDKTKADSDGDGLKDGVEAPEGNGIDSDKDGKIDALDDDDDADGVLTKDEVALTASSTSTTDVDGDKNANWLDKDADGDGVEDLADGLLDVDGDGIPGFLDPNDKDGPNGDLDGDGIPNGIEDNTGTDKTKADSDGDGIPDGIEDANKDGKIDAGETDPRKNDSDGDGILDGVEDANKDGKVDAGETDPRKDDSDGDGLLDGVEDTNKDGKVDAGETDPRLADTDGDSLGDGLEDANKNGIVDGGELDPRKSDTDGDALPDGIEDADKDGKLTPGETDGTNPDSDGDSLPDGLEDTNKDGAFTADETDPRKADTDGDGLGDGAEDANKDGKVDPAETDPRKADTDGGGVGDGLEVKTDGTNPLDPADDKVIPGDQDGDGIPDTVEDATGTDKTKLDSDGDGLPDGVEDANKDGKLDASETDPRKVDSDGDTLGDGVEDANKDGKVDATETDPRLADTDGGGVNDGQELKDTTDPLVKEDDGSKTDTDGDGLPDQLEDKTGTDKTKADSDGDGLSDGAEDANKDGKVSTGETDPRKADTDGGGVNDGQEVNTDKTNPLDPKDDKKIAGDQDGDGIPDSVEDATGTDKTKADTDGDGLADGVEDANKDGKVDATETDPRKADTDGDKLNDGIEDANKNGKVDAGETDPRKADTDGGGVNDGQEVNTDKTNPLDPKDDKKNVPDGDQDGDGIPDSVEDATGTDKTKADTDGDGLKDGAEDKNGNGKVDAGETDPRKADTDGGGVPDGVELANGANPLDPTDDLATGSILEGGCAVASPGTSESSGAPGLLGLGLIAGVLARLRRRRLAAPLGTTVPRHVVPAALRRVSRRAAFFSSSSVARSRLAPQPAHVAFLGGPEAVLAGVAARRARPVQRARICVSRRGTFASSPVRHLSARCDRGPSPSPRSRVMRSDQSPALPAPWQAKPARIAC